MRDDLAQQDPTPIPPAEWGPGYQLWQAIQSLLRQRGPEGTTSLVRMASHLAIIVIAVAVLWISRQATAPARHPRRTVITADGAEEDRGNRARRATSRKRTSPWCARPCPLP